MRNALYAIDEWARDLAGELLAWDLARWQHVRAVAAKARALGDELGSEDRRTLVAAAYLHDVGYAAAARRTGFHALDGGLFMRDLGEERLGGLVANHSGATVEADLRGLGDALRAFPDEGTEVRDMLWYCDLTTGQTGSSVSLDERLSDVSRRYGDQHVVTRALTTALPQLAKVVERVEARARARGRAIG